METIIKLKQIQNIDYTCYRKSISDKLALSRSSCGTRLDLFDKTFLSSDFFQVFKYVTQRLAGVKYLKVMNVINVSGKKLSCTINVTTVTMTITELSRSSCKYRLKHLEANSAERKGDKTSHACTSWRAMLECHARASSDKNTYVTPKAAGNSKRRMSRHDNLLTCITDRYDRPCRIISERSLRRLEQKNCSIGLSNYNYQLIMVISTRDDSTVNTVLKLVEFSGTPKVPRLYRVRRRKSKKPREPIRTMELGISSIMSQSGRSNLKSSHVHNYDNVVISTRCFCRN